ncbi:MAG TPA: cysteine rich repeat-containing protein [Anaeromyxobacteraceae bacterium]|nr:cysteine rich repeat-containing protein [Anaeromyxobacteraceae bacterium]
MIARGTCAALLLITGIAGSAGSARAQDACRADVERLCQGIPAGGGRIAACLKANSAKVSPECKAELASVRQKVKEVGEACRADVESYCAGVKPGRENVLRCLAQNRAMLTPRCQGVVQGAQEKAAEFRKACGKDAKKLCKGIPSGQGRILACLESRKPDLSPACQGLFGR